MDVHGQDKDSSRVAVLEAEQGAREPDGDAHAILVLHGIGQQHPFEVLDSVTRGVTKTVSKTIGFDRIDRIRHVTHGVGVPFDHSMIVTYRDGQSEQPVTLHIFEYFWASKTAGKASLLDILKWIRITAFTPVQRFAFNVPLILERVGQEHSGWNYFVSLGYQVMREIWRMIYIPIVFLLIAGLAAYLTVHSAEFAGQLFGNVKSVIFPQAESSIPPDIPGMAPWLDANTIKKILWLILACGAAIGTIGIVLSLPFQWLDVVRTEAWTRDRTKGFFQLTAEQWENKTDNNTEKQSLPHILRKAWTASAKEDRRISLEIPARRWLFFFSWIALCALGGILWAFVKSSVGSGILLPIDWPHLISPIALLVLAWGLKVIIADYIGDIALYATADENSTFFAIRRQILDEATQKLRWLLRQKHMTSVAIAGHSLGSVIAYDAIGWLRVETQGTPAPVPHPASSPAASTSPVTADEYEKIRTLITFGSPLNKVVYFFRTKLPPYQTIRAYILDEIHGFRRVSEHHTDPLIVNAKAAPHDTLLWVNVSALFDPISAKLVFFRKICEYRPMYWLPIFCHLSYWNDERFYRTMLHAVLRKEEFSREPISKSCAS